MREHGFNLASHSPEYGAGGGHIPGAYDPESPSGQYDASPPAAPYDDPYAAPYADPSAYPDDRPPYGRSASPPSYDYDPTAGYDPAAGYDVSRYDGPPASNDSPAGYPPIPYDDPYTDPTYTAPSYDDPYAASFGGSMPYNDGAPAYDSEPGASYLDEAAEHASSARRSSSGGYYIADDYDYDPYLAGPGEEPRSVSRSGATSITSSRSQRPSRSASSRSSDSRSFKSRTQRSVRAASSREKTSRSTNSRRGSASASSPVGSSTPIQDIGLILRSFFSSDPRRAVLRASQTDDWRVWLILMLLTILIGIFSTPAIFLYKEMVSFPLLILHAFGRMIFSCILPVLFYLCVRWTGHSGLRSGQIINVVAATLIPFALGSLLQLGFVFVWPPLATAFAYTGRFLHFLLLYSGMKEEDLGSTRGFHWLFAAYVMVQSVLINSLLL